MFEESVFSYLRKKQPEIICSQVVKICGIGESQVAADIQDMIEAQTNPTLAPYAKTGEVHLRITAKGEDEKECKKLIKPVVRELKRRLAKIFLPLKLRRPWRNLLWICCGIRD